MRQRSSLVPAVVLASSIAASLDCGGGQSAKPATDAALPGPEVGLWAPDAAADAAPGMGGAPDGGGTAGSAGTGGRGGAAGMPGTGGEKDAAMATGGAVGGNGRGGQLDGAVSRGGAAGGMTVQGGAGGAGGVSGSGGALPSIDASCALASTTAYRQPVDVLLVLDRSTSLHFATAEDCFCFEEDALAAGYTSGPLCRDLSNCQSRWSAIESAVSVTVSDSQPIHWGLKLFPTPSATSECVVTSTVEVPIEANSAAVVQSQIASAPFGTSTPTAAALTAATAYLQTRTDDHPRFILLATDGEPNCRGGRLTNTDMDGAFGAAAAASAAGFPVYVVGIGPNLENLTALAKAGGTDDYYPALAAEQLKSAFAAVSEDVASCTFLTTLQLPGDNNVFVYLDKNLIQRDEANGWVFGGSTRTIVLNGLACDRVRSGQASTVQVLFGCPSSPPPPEILP